MADTAADKMAKSLARVADAQKKQSEWNRVLEEDAAAAKATAAKTARLKKLRLAKEAEDKAKAEAQPKKKPVKRAAKAAGARATSAR